MSLYTENKNFSENRAQLGMGAAIYTKFPEFAKYGIRFLGEKIPSVSGDKESVEINVTTSTSNSKLMGKETLNDAEFEIYAHRDNRRMLEEMDGKTYDFLTASADMTGEKFSATVSYKMNERTSGDPDKATVKLTPLTKPEYVDNISPLIMETAKFIGEIPSILDLATTVGTATIDVVTDPTGATVTAISETAAVCTVTATANKVTITGVKEGTAIVELTTKKEGCLPMKRTILVRVPATAAPKA